MPKHAALWAAKRAPWAGLPGVSQRPAGWGGWGGRTVYPPRLQIP